MYPGNFKFITTLNKVFDYVKAAVDTSTASKAWQCPLWVLVDPFRISMQYWVNESKWLRSGWSSAYEVELVQI